MKNKKYIMYGSIILLILFILWIGIFVIKKQNNKKELTIDEYIPEAEITEEQLRKTNILLYFYDNEKGELLAEAREIDSKDLLENPEKTLIDFLIEGPQNDNLEQLIPTGTKLISTEKEKGILYINFSEEFIEVNNIEIDKKEKTMEAILKTVSQLNEIQEIKILINGEENKIL